MIKILPFTKDGFAATYGCSFACFGSLVEHSPFEMGNNWAAANQIAYYITVTFSFDEETER